MKIVHARFVMSSPTHKLCPKSTFPEYAFIGRSNVGKSSLINMLTDNNKLAHTSATPGKTRLINYYAINNAWHLVDLPGYGWAKLGQKERAKLKEMIEGYLLHRDNLFCTFLLIDIRHEPQAVDIEFMNWLGENQVAFVLVFTKADKISKAAAQKNVENYFQKISDFWEELPPYFITSSETKVGKEEILEFIHNTNTQNQK